MGRFRYLFLLEFGPVGRQRLLDRWQIGLFRMVLQDVLDQAALLTQPALSRYVRILPMLRQQGVELFDLTGRMVPDLRRREDDRLLTRFCCELGRIVLLHTLVVDLTSVRLAG